MFAVFILQINICKTAFPCSRIKAALQVMEIISMVSKCCLALHKGVCCRHEQRGEWRSCERGMSPDPAVNETLPVPLSVLTGRLCHTTDWSCRQAPAVTIPLPWAAYWVVSIKKTSVSWVPAFSMVDMFVAQQAKAIPPVKHKQKERGGEPFFLYNQSLRKFDSVLNRKRKTFRFLEIALFLFSQTFQLVQKQWVISDWCDSHIFFEILLIVWQLPM